MIAVIKRAPEFSCAQLHWEGGLLEVRFHTNGGPFAWSPQAYSEVPELFAAIAADRDTRVVILTGTGDSFCGSLDVEGFRAVGSSDDLLYWQATHLLPNLFQIEALVIGAVNGPALVHAELPVVSDIVLCSDATVFQDRHMLQLGIVPGDGAHIVWPELLGSNRGRYFLLTGEELHAREARELGIVSEVLPQADLLPRARQLAQDLLRKPPLTLRYTRLCLIQRWRRLLQDDLSHGMLLEIANRGAVRAARSAPPPAP
jgi:enoyl-CoA hydratase/carnithine racemase